MKKGTTWWQNHADERWISEVGGVFAASRVAIRKHFIESGCKSVVDFGCGLAADAEILTVEGVRYTGVEQCEKFRELAGVYANILPSLTELPSKSADTVYCRHVLEHLPEPETAIAEMIRVARCEVLVVTGEPPGVTDEVSYDGTRDLFWNVWSKPRYDAYLNSRGGTVINWFWKPLLTFEGRGRKDESVLFIKLNHASDHPESRPVPEPVQAPAVQPLTRSKPRGKVLSS